MVQRPRCREAERPRGDAVADEASHLPDLLGRGRLTGRSPLTHDEEPHGAVGHEGADVDVAWAPVERAQVLVEALPLPGDALVQGRARDVLDALHQLDQSFVVRRPDRGEADAAVAHYDGRHAMPRRRREPAVPRRLAVVMGVNVDEPGRDQRAVGVDLPCRPGADPTDLGDHAPVDRDVGRERLAPTPVDDRSSPDDQVVHDTIVARADAARQGPSACQPFDSYAADGHPQATAARQIQPRRSGDLPQGELPHLRRRQPPLRDPGRAHQAPPGVAEGRHRLRRRPRPDEDRRAGPDQRLHPQPHVRPRRPARGPGGVLQGGQPGRKVTARDHRAGDRLPARVP